jgi:hypothetical protein
LAISAISLSKGSVIVPSAHGQGVALGSAPRLADAR